MNPQQAKALKQLQQIQQKIAEAQEQLAHETVEASAGGGAVTAVVSGDLVVREVRIKPEAADLDDVEMLQDLVLAAVNEALRAAHELAQKKMNAASAGFEVPGIPGLF